MRGLRVMRVVLPAALILLAIALLNEWRPRPTAHSEPTTDVPRERQRVERVKYHLLKNGKPALSGALDLLEELADGRVLVEGVDGLEIQRADRGPLVIDAALGEGHVDPGASRWQFRREVVLRDPEAGLELRLPELEVDEAAGEARAEGEIVFSGPSVAGSADRLVYGLRGQPSELWEPRLQMESDGASLTARRALLLDGLEEIEWRDSVTFTREDGVHLATDRLHFRRTAEGRPIDAEADGGVVGRWPLRQGGAGRLRAAAVAAGWDDTGSLASLRMTGEVELTRGTALASAARLELRRTTDGLAPWRLEADGNVVAEGPIGLDLGRIAADHVLAWLTEEQSVRSAVASGGVVFQSQGTRGEAERATFGVDEHGATIELTEVAPRKARLARDRTRVAADRIRTDPAGSRLEAEGRVEATMLPLDGEGQGALGGLFALDDAVNFVAERMTSREQGRRIRFEGGARGWQGERSLAAESIEFDQTTRSLTATEQVSSRMPRGVDSAGTSAADYVQIVARSMEYDDRESRAGYDGDVRLSVVEGWLESERLEVRIGPTSGRVERIDSTGSVRLEWRTDAGSAPITGSADRVVYEPALALIRLFGEDAPAAVSRSEGAGGRTTGRVLTYHVDDGTLEVDSGESGTGRIRTGGGTR